MPEWEVWKKQVVAESPCRVSGYCRQDPRARKAELMHCPPLASASDGGGVAVCSSNGGTPGAVPRGVADRAMV